MNRILAAIYLLLAGIAAIGIGPSVCGVVMASIGIVDDAAFTQAQMYEGDPTPMESLRGKLIGYGGMVFPVVLFAGLVFGPPLYGVRIALRVLLRVQVPPRLSAGAGGAVTFSFFSLGVMILSFWAVPEAAPWALLVGTLNVLLWLLLYQSRSSVLVENEEELR